ncbi:ATPase with role in protein import into the ER [Ceratobasidium sp. 394]|nr:ATPase with role in protein import into the ER [Ceratobasidium sp. 394]
MLRTLLLSFLFFQLSFLSGAGVSTDHNTPVIGIDLGTTCSCVAIYQNGRTEIIPIGQGERITPSWVSFRGRDRVVGEAAKHAFHAAPAQTIYSVKRLIGRTYEDLVLLREIKSLPFEVINRGGRPTIEIDNHGLLQHFTPEEISAMILSRMKQTAEAYVGTKVSRAVVTVPAYFNDAQRQATKDAGKIAGLDIICMINEPTAAALASKASRIIVYDLGSGTLDVSLLSFKNNAFTVVATSGNDHLGGEDFDVRVIEYFTASYLRCSGFDVTTNARSMSKLKREVERATRILLHQASTLLEIEAFH